MMMTGPKKAEGIRPMAIPLFATIRATSPRQAIPTPTWTHWRPQEAGQPGPESAADQLGEDGHRDQQDRKSTISQLRAAAQP